MGLAYWVLYLILVGTSPLVFCVSELSWTASYIFLTLRLYADVPKEKHKKKAIFWILPLFSLWIFAAALIFYAAEYLLWGSSYFIAENTFINPYYLVDIFIMNPALILIAVAQSREEKLCRTI